MSANWKNTTIYLGNLKPSNKVKFAFKALRKLDIKHVVASCSNCTKVNHFNEDTLELVGLYRTGAYPKHFKFLSKNQYDVVKTILVTYGSGKQEMLTIKGTIINE